MGSFLCQPALVGHDSRQGCLLLGPAPVALQRNVRGENIHDTLVVLTGLTVRTTVERGKQPRWRRARPWHFFRRFRKAALVRLVRLVRLVWYGSVGPHSRAIIL